MAYAFIIRLEITAGIENNKTMKVYHQVPRRELEAILTSGLHCDARGEKGANPLIKKTDGYLDEHRPKSLRRAGISRNTNVYGYLGNDQTLIDIIAGKETPISRYTNDVQQLLRLVVSVDDCFVSDLDRYDAVKAAFGSKAIGVLPELAEKYWQSVTKLSEYSPSQFSRPEIMIVRDVLPDEISCA